MVGKGHLYVEERNEKKSDAEKWRKEGKKGKGGYVMSFFCVFKVLLLGRRC